jgi:hypothetical protein
MFKLLERIFKEKPLGPGDVGYTWGFRDRDFIRMHFFEKNAYEEGALAWVDFGQGTMARGSCGDRLYLVPVSKKLRKRWKAGEMGAFPIYDTERLELCKLATPNDNKEIREYLFENYKPEFAKRYYEAWLKRLGNVDVSA